MTPAGLGLKVVYLLTNNLIICTPTSITIIPYLKYINFSFFLKNPIFFSLDNILIGAGGREGREGGLVRTNNL